MIRATVNEWSPRDEPGRKIYSLRLKMVYMLADIREKLVKSVDVSLNINQLKSDLINSLEAYTVKEGGKILKFSIHDPESNMKLKLFSRTRQVELSDEFINYLKDNPGFDFRLA
jgi:hypothetical protein